MCNCILMICWKKRFYFASEGLSILIPFNKFRFQIGFCIRLSSCFHIHIHIHFHIRSRAKKNVCEEQSGKFFYRCLETIKGYGNVQTFIKKFAGNLLKINVKLAPSPLIDRAQSLVIFTFTFTFIFTFDREPKKNLCEEQSGKFFYHCLETIKGYGNVQTFIKKFAGNLLKFNVKLAPSPLFGRFTLIFTLDREP